MRELTADERAKLEGRVGALSGALRPFDNHEIPVVEAELAAMFSGFRAMRQTGEDVASVVEVTRRVLAEFPAWAIAKACLLIARNQAVVDGKHLDRRYTPNDTEIYAVVSSLVKMRREALTSAKALLSAPVEPPAPQRPKDGPSAPRPQRAPQAPPVPAGDGKHAERVAADLAARAARRAAQQPTEDQHGEA